MQGAGGRVQRQTEGLLTSPQKPASQGSRRLKEETRGRWEMIAPLGCQNRAGRSNPRVQLHAEPPSTFMHYPRILWEARFAPDVEGVEAMKPSIPLIREPAAKERGCSSPGSWWSGQAAIQGTSPALPPLEKSPRDPGPGERESDLVAPREGTHQDLWGCSQGQVRHRGNLGDYRNIPIDVRA